MDSAALRPAPMARITVAPPVTISPPANTPRFEVRVVSGSVDDVVALCGFQIRRGGLDQRIRRGAQSDDGHDALA